MPKCKQRVGNRETITTTILSTKLSFNSMCTTSAHISFFTRIFPSRPPNATLEWLVTYKKSAAFEAYPLSHLKDGATGISKSKSRKLLVIEFSWAGLLSTLKNLSVRWYVRADMGWDPSGSSTTPISPWFILNLNKCRTFFFIDHRMLSNRMEVHTLGKLHIDLLDT